MTSKPRDEQDGDQPPMESNEVPILSSSERAALLASLREAEERAKSGEAIDYDPATFKARLLDIYRNAKL